MKIRQQHEIISIGRRIPLEKIGHRELDVDLSCQCQFAGMSNRDVAQVDRRDAVAAPGQPHRVSALTASYVESAPGSERADDFEDKLVSLVAVP